MGDAAYPDDWGGRLGAAETRIVECTPKASAARSVRTKLTRVGQHGGHFFSRSPLSLGRRGEREKKCPKNRSTDWTTPRLHSRPRSAARPACIERRTEESLHARRVRCSAGSAVLGDPEVSAEKLHHPTHRVFGVRAAKPVT